MVSSGPSSRWFQHKSWMDADAAMERPVVPTINGQYLLGPLLALAGQIKVHAITILHHSSHSLVPTIIS